jgi:hypothetical protein
MMKCNKWTLALAAAGVVSLGSVVQAEEAQHQVLTALSSTTLSGYVDTSATWQPGTTDKHIPGVAQIPGRVFDSTADKLDGFNLEVVKLSLEKPLDEGQWSAGYKADLLFGPNASFYSTEINGGGINTDDFAVKQAYVALRAPVGNGLDLKVGVLDTIVGYEVFDSPNNPNFSRSYGFALEPTHHTGALASYHVADWLSVSGGVANTAYGPINGKGHEYGEAESSKTYMGSVVLTAPDSFGPVAGSVVYGGVVGGSAYGQNENGMLLYLGATIKTPLQNLSVGAAWDYREDGPNMNSSENRAYSLAGYVTWAFTEKFRANARLDYLNADGGTFYPGTDTEELLAGTLTLDYSLWDNILTRAEFRWDHSLNDEHPYNGLDDKDAYTLTANIVYKF